MPHPDSPDLERLLDRVLAGEATADEQARWAALAARDPAVAALADGLRAEHRADADAWNTDGAWRRLATTVQAPNVRPLAPRRVSRAWWGVAAAAGIAIAALGTWRVTTQRATPTMVASAAHTIAAPNGQRREATLPDGTRIVLDAGSRLTYGDDYGRGARDVVLDGAAYFAVTHDAARPFRVRTRDGVAEDLGTRFVVRAYAERPGVEVAVAEGRVAVRAAASTRAGVVLGRAQVASVHADGTIAVAEHVDVDARLGWTHGELAYDDVPVADALPQLARWYDVDLRLGDPRLATRHLTARFVAGQAPGTVLDAVAIALGARAVRAGRVVTFVPVTGR